MLIEIDLEGEWNQVIAQMKAYDINFFSIEIFMQIYSFAYCQICINIAFFIKFHNVQNVYSLDNLYHILITIYLVGMVRYDGVLTGHGQRR